ncbi:MAG TPA: hypothetical protein VK363_09350, partial [Pyrinomonadaceae bacterium]|nr:hypothetical protein [Pyrinomonadaceae bacterium]
MRKRFTYLSLAALASVALTGAFFYSTVSGGQSDRGQCQQTCTRQYQECRNAANANNDACRQAFDTCRAGCRDNTNGNT